MIAKKSDLILINFSIVDSRVLFVDKGLPNNKDINPLDFFEKYPVDIDFELGKDESLDVYRMVTRVQVNNSENNEAGYSINVTGLCFFSFDKDSLLTQEQKSQMLKISGLSICITNLRLYIANQSSYFPWGPYSFYAVDIQELLSDKSKSIK